MDTLREHTQERKEITCSCCEGSGVIEQVSPYGMARACSECHGSGAILLDELVCVPNCPVCIKEAQRRLDREEFRGLVQTMGKEFEDGCVYISKKELLNEIGV
jgi:RecJ-like exonuclease